MEARVYTGVGDGSCVGKEMNVNDKPKVLPVDSQVNGSRYYDG